MTPRERQIVFRGKIRAIMNIITIEFAMVLVTVTWLFGIW